MVTKYSDYVWLGTNVTSDYELKMQILKKFMLL